MRSAEHVLRRALSTLGSASTFTADEQSLRDVRSAELGDDRVERLSSVAEHHHGVGLHE